MCGKVFRRQLALERHVDVHHSSRSSVSHKCEVCGKTFGSRNTLTMHRTVHGTQTTALRNSPTPPSGPSSPRCDTSPGPEESDEVAEASESGVMKSNSITQTDVEASSGEKDTEEVEICADEEEAEIVWTRSSRQAETENENPEIQRRSNSGRPVADESDFAKVSENVVTTAISGRRSAMTLANVHLPARNGGDPLTGPQSDPVAGAVLDLFSGQAFSSTELMSSNECAQQSIEFTEMLVEEIVSESLFQHSEHPSADDTNLEWSQSDRCLVEAAKRNASAGLRPDVEYDRLNDPVTKRQRLVETVVDLQPPPHRRANRVRSEGARKNQEKARQLRLSEEADVEAVDDLARTSTPMESQSSASRQTTANRTPYVCVLCHKSFDSEKYLSMHMPLHRPYVETAETTRGVTVSVSDVVEAELQLLQGLPITGGGAKQKKVVASEMQQWTCQYCQKSFMQNSNYKNHMRTHSDERPFVCEMCNIGFKERYHLKKHVLFKHTTDLKETCRVCGKCFKDSTAVRAHERIHSELRPYSCNLCGKTFKTSECLWHHENRSKTCGKSALRRNDAAAAAASLTRQNEPGGSTSAPRRVRKPRQSPAGGGGAKVKSPRQSQKIGDVSQNCKSMSKPFSPIDEDGRRMQSEIEASVMSIKTEPDCDLFDQGLQAFLSNEQDLKNILEIFDFDAHKDGSSTEETGSDLTDSDTSLPKESEDFGSSSAKCSGLECTKCAKKFSSTATFEKHMVMHNEERPYRCTLCDNGFKLKVHLKKHHLYRHSDEYPCECSICGKRFKDSSAVRLHERIHSSDRPFRCHCGKGFKTRENLWGHRNRGPCEKTQDFITNNIRLFRSAEFGPILGVPIGAGPGAIVSSGLVPNSAANGSLVDACGRTINGPQQQSVQAVLLKTTQGAVTSTPHSVQFVPSCVLSTPGFSPGQTSRQVKVALRLIKPRACDVTTCPTSILPTAIVTPIQREGAVQASSSPNLQQSSETGSKKVDTSSSPTRHVPTKLEGSRADSSASVHPNISTSVASSPDDNFPKTVADLATGMRNQSSVAEKCPTVQKYLERSSTASIRILEMNSLAGTTMVSGGRSHSGHDQQKPPTVTFKRQKLDSIGEDNSSTEGDEKNGQKQYDISVNCGSSFADQESQESGSLPVLDPLLPNSPFPACTSMYPDIEDYGDMKYDPNDPTLNIGDMYWGDSDNTLSSGWILENESLFSDLSLTSNFGII